MQFGTERFGAHVKAGFSPPRPPAAERPASIDRRSTMARDELLEALFGEIQRLTKEGKRRPSPCPSHLASAVSGGKRYKPCGLSLNDRSLRLELDRVRITHGFSCEPVPLVAAVIILVRDIHDDFAHLSECTEPGSSQQRCFKHEVGGADKAAVRTSRPRPSSMPRWTRLLRAHAASVLGTAGRFLGVWTVRARLPSPSVAVERWDRASGRQ